MTILWNMLSTTGKVIGALTVGEKIVTRTGLDQPRSQSELDEEITMSEQQRDPVQVIVEEIEVEGRQLIARVKQLLHEGNIRKLRLKDEKGRYLLEVPLTVGVVAGGVLAFASPVMLALSAVAGLVANVTIEIVREDSSESGQ